MSKALVDHIITEGRTDCVDLRQDWGNIRLVLLGKSNLCLVIQSSKEKKAFSGSISEYQVPRAVLICSSKYTIPEIACKIGIKFTIIYSHSPRFFCLLQRPKRKVKWGRSKSQQLTSFMCSTTAVLAISSHVRLCACQPNYGPSDKGRLDWVLMMIGILL